MSATTDRFSIPYPLSEDKVSDYPGIAAAAAAALEAALAPSSQTIDPMSGWTWNRQGGLLVTSGSVHTLNIDIKRAAASFTKAANATFDFAVIPSSVPTPTGIAFAGVLIGGGQSNPVYIQNGRVYCYCDTSTTITNGWDYRAALTWIA